MSTYTPRTDAAWEKTFKDDEDQCRAGNAASDMRDECATIERELAAAKAECEKMKTELGVGVWHSAELSSELARLRAEVERLMKQIKDDNRSYGCELRDPNGTIWEQATKDRARAERAEAELKCYADAVDDAAMKEDNK